MKINRVTATGFGPFKSQQVVDFDAFDAEGLFLISGKTGAGKSSILDAVTFALYGTTPRYEGKSEARYRSDHIKPGEQCEVAVEFSVGGDRYRVIRSPEYTRPKQRGEGETRQPAKASLELQLADGTWQGKATLPSQVGNMVQDIVGLNANQFLQVMLLAQNRFQEFLVAETRDRRQLLKQLFSTERFEDYENQLDIRRSSLEKNVGKVQVALTETTRHLQELVSSLVLAGISKGNQVGTEDVTAVVTEGEDDIVLIDGVMPDVEGYRLWLAQVAKRATANLEQMQTESQSANAALAQAQLELARIEEVSRLQRKRATAQAILAETADLQPQCEDWRKELALNERAQRALPTLRSAKDAAKAVAAATTRRQQTEADLAKLSLLCETDQTVGPQLDKLITAIQNQSGDYLAETQNCRDLVTGELAASQTPLNMELALPGLTAELATAATRTSQKTESRAELLAEIARQKELLVRHEAEIAEVTPIAETLGLCQTELAKATELKQMVATVTTKRLAAAQAEQKAEAAAAEQKAAALEVDRLWEARFQGIAGELATELTPGEPCRVCGATEHPAPAPPEETQVTAEVVAEAQRNAQAATERATAAHQAFISVSQEVTKLDALAGGATAAQAEAAEVLASQNVAAATTAATTRAKLTKAVADLTAKIAAQSNEAELLVADIQQLTSAETVAKEKLATAAQQVETATKGFATITERVQQLTKAEKALTELLDATLAFDTAQAANQKAQSDTVAILAELQFEDAREAEGAVLPEQQRQAVAAQLQQIEHRAAAAQADLSDPALQEIPLEPVETEPASQAVAEAQAAMTKASERLGAAGQLQTQVADLVSQARSNYAKAEAAIAEFTVVKRLSDTIRGLPPNERRMRLIDYVLAAELEQIVAAANGRLRTMRNGRYTLEHSDAKGKKAAQSGLGLQIMDAHTGVARPTQSLSGGEKFLASLALALGLAETVANRAGGITLDTLFIDEGFGSLDDETLEIAMETLDSLRNNGRTVGVISHVGLMQERIPARVEVAVMPGGWSEVTQP